mmetsp:Transcript_30304/g.78287  ORF Transcript_30304/g.78287 Transcript_30304/m.78287 type:complete len:433 (-) Transcript_30304:300-1598(-)
MADTEIAGEDDLDLGVLDDMELSAPQALKPRTFLTEMQEKMPLTPSSVVSLLAKLPTAADYADQTPPRPVPTHHIAVLFVHLSQSRTACRRLFAAHSHGLPLLAEIMKEAIATLEGKESPPILECDIAESCLRCLLSIPLGRSRLRQLRGTLAKPVMAIRNFVKGNHPHCKRLRPHVSACLKTWKEGKDQDVLDPVRKKVVERITEALQQGRPDDLPHIDQSVLAQDTARQIEEALFDSVHEVGVAYRERARMLKFNLSHAHNHELRRLVMLGEMPVSDLVDKTSMDLAPEDLKRQREEEKQRDLAHTIDKVGLVVPSACHKSDEAYDWNMAPPPTPDSAEEDDKGDESAPKKRKVEETPVGSPTLMPPPKHKPHEDVVEQDLMPPPPTPFHDDLHHEGGTPDAGAVAPKTPAVMDVEVENLLHRLENPVKL